MGMVSIDKALSNAGIALTDLYITTGHINPDYTWQNFSTTINVNDNDEYIIYAKDSWTSPYPVAIWRVKISGGAVTTEILYDERGSLSYPQLIKGTPNAAGWFSLGAGMTTNSFGNICVIYKFR